jgi:hypothetical protein
MIRTLIQQARKRLLWNQLAAGLALAGTLMAAGLILLLIAGTRILDWQFPTLLGLGGLVVGVVVAVRHLPSSLATAITLDRAAGLHDALSTALHFENRPPQPATEAQRQQAETLVRGVDLSAALPLQTPRALYWMATLFVAASGLFALRFGLTHTLDLRPTLVNAVMDSLGMAARKPGAQPTPAKPRRDDFLAKLGIHVPEGAGTIPMDREQPGASPTADAALSSPQNAVSAPGAQTADAKEPGGEKSGNNEKSDGQKGGKGEPSGKQQKPEGENSSLVAKMKEALSNLMAKAKQQAAEGNPQQKAGGQQAGEKKSGSQQQAKGGQKSQQGDAQQQGGQQASSSEESAQAGKSSDAKDQANGKNSDQQLSSQAGSGVGRQDGSKDLKAAAQLNAMGKLSQIIGKRSQNVTGEMMLDTQGGSQQLKTAYTHSGAQHSDAGGDVSRDEVPLAVQPYVQQYFEQVRKQDSPKHKAAAATKSVETAN